MKRLILLALLTSCVEEPQAPVVITTEQYTAKIGDYSTEIEIHEGCVLVEWDDKSLVVTHEGMINSLSSKNSRTVCYNSEVPAGKSHSVFISPKE